MEAIIAELKKLIEDNPSSRSQVEATIRLLVETERCAEILISGLPTVEEIPISTEIHKICDGLFSQIDHIADVA